MLTFFENVLAGMLRQFNRVKHSRAKTTARCGKKDDSRTHEALEMQMR
jgi:hypothetical protein